MVTKELLDRNPDIEFAIIRWNIDRFRTLHSLYGDEVASKLLQELANFFLTNMQVPSTYARLENDNFVCCVRKDEHLYGRLLTKAVYSDSTAQCARSFRTTLTEDENHLHGNCTTA